MDDFSPLPMLLIIGMAIAVVVGVIIPSCTPTANNVTENTTVVATATDIEEPPLEEEILEKKALESAWNTVKWILVGMGSFGFLVFIVIPLISDAVTRGTEGPRPPEIRLEGPRGSKPNPPNTLKSFSKLDTFGGINIFDQIGVSAISIDRLRDNRCVDCEPLELIQNDEWELWWDINFDWYAVEKNPNFEMYKVVGLHKRQRGLNCIYLVGQDSHTGTPYILRCPPEYVKEPLQDCVRWNMGVNPTDMVYEV